MYAERHSFLVLWRFQGTWEQSKAKARAETRSFALALGREADPEWLSH